MAHTDTHKGDAQVRARDTRLSEAQARRTIWHWYCFVHVMQNMDAV
jgi:hypothetical protein